MNGVKLNEKTLVCWDAAIFIDWLRGDKISQIERIQPIKSVVKLIEAGQIQLVVPTLLYAEVLQNKMGEESFTKFEKFMKKKEVIKMFALDIKIAKTVGAIRNQTSLKTLDAVYVATAIISGASVLHTFDKKLLEQNGKPEVGGLAITECTFPSPNSQQTSLL